MLTTILLLSISPRTVIFVAIVIILLFGAKRIPELFRGVGQGVREFKNASREENPEFRDRPMNSNPASTPTNDPNAPRV
jgi:sec-independent protein translocase protein TatA